MAILVTGGAGFIGSHMIERLLSKGKEPIVCLDNFNDYYDSRLKRSNISNFINDQQVTIVEDDFCNVGPMQKLFDQHDIRSVIHLGAYAGVRASVESPHIYQHANVAGTLALLEAARQHKVQRFLLASSSTVYGRGANIPFQEDGPLGIPMSPYGATKRAAELLGLTYFDLHQVPVVCLRPFSVYGPRLRPDLALTIFVRAIAAGTPIPLYGDGSIQRDFTHVTDICAGLNAALHADKVVGETINLGHSKPVEMKLLIGMLEDAMQQKANIEYRPARPEDLPITFADLSKASRLLGYQPQVKLEEGLRDYVHWFRRTSLIQSTK